MKIDPNEIELHLFVGEEFGVPLWAWDDQQLDNGTPPQYRGKLPRKTDDFTGFHCGRHRQNGCWGIIDSRYNIALSFEYDEIAPVNAYLHSAFLYPDTYYFRVRQQKNWGYLMIERQQLTWLLPIGFNKMVWLDHADYLVGYSKSSAGLYNLRKREFELPLGKYTDIKGTPFGVFLNVFIKKDCWLYDYRQKRIPIDEPADIYFGNTLNPDFKEKIYAIRGEALFQYNPDNFQPEPLEIGTTMKGYRLQCIKQCPMPAKFKKLIIDKYLAF